MATFTDLVPTESEAAGVVGGPCAWADFPLCVLGTTVTAFLHID